MNTERLLVLAEHLRRTPDNEFNMLFWGNACDTAGCIAGHTVQLFRHLDVRLDARLAGCIVPVLAANRHPAVVAAKILDLDVDTADTLFTPDFMDEDDEPILRYESITPAMAAAVVEHLANTGTVNWDLVVTEAAGCES